MTRSHMAVRRSLLVASDTERTCGLRLAMSTLVKGAQGRDLNFTNHANLLEVGASRPLVGRLASRPVGAENVICVL